MEPVTILIPAYNEEKAIGVVLEALKELKIPGEILVVDDGSTDATAEEARRHGVRVLRRGANAGYGRTVKEGIMAASHDIIILSDADGTYPIEKIPELVSVFLQGHDMVVGARHGAAYRGTFLKMPARIVFKFIAEFTTGRHIPDVNSGMRVFRKRDAVPYFPDLCNGFSFTTTITLVYMLTGRTVTYVPVPYHHRIGRSKVKIVRDSLRTLQYMTEAIATYNPIKLFLLFALIALVPSLALLAVAAATGDAVLLLCSAVLGIGAMLLFGQGVQADVLGKIRRSREQFRPLLPPAEEDAAPSAVRRIVEEKVREDSLSNPFHRS